MGDQVLNIFIEVFYVKIGMQFTKYISEAKSEFKPTISLHSALYINTKPLL